MGMGAVAGATLAAGALSAGTSLIGSSQASGAAKQAANLQAQQYALTRGDLAPYNVAGQNVLDPLTALAKSGPTGGYPDYLREAATNVPLQMSQAQLEQTPGYQFTLGQGMKGLQSAAAARGLGVSGASMKAGGAYSTGLANQTYKDQFNLAQQRFTDYINLNAGVQTNVANQYARLHDTAALGENAAAQTGTTGATLAGQQGNYLNQAGLASAAGTTGVGTAATGAAQSYLNNQLLQAYLNPQAPAAAYGGGPAPTPVTAIQVPAGVSPYSYGPPAPL